MKTFKNARKLAALSAAFLFATSAGPVLAAPGPADTHTGNNSVIEINFSSRAAQTHEAQKVIQQATNKMFAALKANKAALKKDPSLIYDLMEDNILEYFDFNVMSRLALGRYWRGASDSQKERFTKAFTKIIERTYAKAISSYTDEKIKYTGTKTSGNKALVQTRIQMSGGTEANVDYALYKNKNGDWKIYNMSVEGISLARNYRSTYGALIKKHGLDGLINMLENKNRQLAAFNSGPASFDHLPGTRFDMS